MSDNTAIDTKSLLRLLQENGDFDQFLQRGGKAINDPALTVFLLRNLNESGVSIAAFANASMISQSFAYQVVSGTRKPGRNTLICIAFALKFDMDQTQRLLAIAQKGALYPRIRRDAAILYALEHGYSLPQTEELLQRIGEGSLLPQSLQACVLQDKPQLKD